MPAEVCVPLPAPTGFKITAKHHPNKVAPVGHGLLHLCHARRERETIRDAGIAAEPPLFAGISGKWDWRGGVASVETLLEYKSRTCLLFRVRKLC